LKSKILNTLRELWKIRFLENILVGLTKNRTYGSLLTKLPPNHYQYNLGSYRKIKRDSINYELDISDIMDWYIYYGFKEISRIKLYSLVSPGNTILDIGANIGVTTLNFAKIVGVSGKVYSFEPDPVNLISLQKNIKLNSFNNIILNKIGLGNNTGKFKIHTMDVNNKGMNRIIEITDNNEIGHEINVTTIDTYVTENKLQKIDVIKIDVEGFEYNVLQGAYNTLKRFHPKLFVELDNRLLTDQGKSAKELIEYLINLEYNIFHAETNEKITVNSNFIKCHYDIVAK